MKSVPTEKPILFSGPMWKPVVGFEGLYEVSCNGDVKSLLSRSPKSNGGLLTHWVQNKGYHYVTLWTSDHKKKTYAVHRLVLDAFVGERPVGKQAAHNDGDPSNNRIFNLRWATAKENIADRKLHGRTVIGEQQHSSKLDRHVVKTIKKMKECGFSAHETARLACVSFSTIDAIWKGETWKHV